MLAVGRARLDEEPVRLAAETAQLITEPQYNVREYITFCNKNTGVEAYRVNP